MRLISRLFTKNESSLKKEDSHKTDESINEVCYELIKSTENGVVVDCIVRLIRPNGKNTIFWLPVLSKEDTDQTMYRKNTARNNTIDTVCKELSETKRKQFYEEIEKILKIEGDRRSSLTF